MRATFTASICVLLALIGYGMIRYPLLIHQAGVWPLLFPALMLVFYSVAGALIMHQPGQIRHSVIREGGKVGLGIGLVFIIMIAVENFSNFGVQAISVLTLAFILLIFTQFGWAGWRGVAVSGQLMYGVLASIWSAMVSVLIALLFGFSINFLFAQHLEQYLQASAEFRRSGIADLPTFTFYNTLDSASTHLLEAPIIALVCGTIGSLIHKGLNWLQPIG